MKIPVGSDHAGFEAKQTVKQMLEDLGHEALDYGTHSEESVDYPEYAQKVSRDINNAEYDVGILVCGSGQGMCMTANKFPNIRAALVYNQKSAEMSRKHNNANILCLPGRELSKHELRTVVEKWLETSFEGGRHERRVNKIKNLT